jgi:hypothetical protein
LGAFDFFDATTGHLGNGTGKETHTKNKKWRRKFLKLL